MWEFMKAAPDYFVIALALLIAPNCFAQQTSPLVYIEGTVTRADQSPLAGAIISLPDGSTLTSNKLGHYFTVLPIGASVSIRAGSVGYTLSPSRRSYTNVSTDQLQQDFSGGTYTVSGLVYSGGANASLYFDGAGQGVTTTTGDFSAVIPEGYSGDIIPLSTALSFNPSSSPFPGNPIFRQTVFTALRLAFSAMPGQICNYARSTEVFSPATAKIYASIQVIGMPGDTFYFLWFDPAGKLRTTTSYTFPPGAPALTGPCIVTSIPIAGTDAAKTPGLWRMDFHGPSYFGSLSQGSIPFAILAQRPPYIAPTLGSMAHLASGDGWDSTIELVNTGGKAANANISFLGDEGNPLVLPLTNASPVHALPPNATLLINSSSPDALQTGYAQLTTDTGVSGFIRFRYAPRDQEAIVPLETRKASSYTLAFDNTNGIATGVAVANLLAVPANIPVLIRDNTGAQIGSASVSLPANGHAAFVLTDRFSSTVNQTGTIEFDTPPSGQITVLGLRFPPSGKFTTIPVLSSTDIAGGSMAHLAVGDGWTTTIELVNYGTTFAQANLSFFNDSGAPLSAQWNVAGNASSASVLNQTLAPHARLIAQSNALATESLQVGSAQLTTNGSVSGFIRFLYGPRNQEAIVPIEARNAGSYILPFDNTNGLVAGVAVANGVGAPVKIPVVIRDNTGARIGLGIVALAPNGHSAFVLSDQFPVAANQSGTIEFGAPADARLSVLGFRFPQSGAFSTIPVLAP